MLPFSKAKWVVGNAGLSIILEQDRRHWLLKTDRMLQVQDDTGSMYQGRVDNEGNSVVLETQKLPEIHQSITEFAFDTQGVSDVFVASDSALPFTYQLNGLACVRITSPQYNYNNQKLNYKIQFNNAEVVYIPFGNAASSGDVFLFKFIRTTSKPTIVMDNGSTISVTAGLHDATNCVYYYPLEDFQPLVLTDLGSGSYETELVDSDSFVGYPAYWFTCDETNHGPMMKFTETWGMMEYGTPGNVTRYHANVYPCIIADATPDQTSFSNYKIQVHPVDGQTFSNSAGDFNIPIDTATIVLKNSTTTQETALTLDIDGNNILTMAADGLWTYASDTLYEAMLGSYFTANSAGNYESHNPLIPLFNIALDESIPFTETTTDTGYVGVSMSSVTEAYPYNLGKWSGIPSYLQMDDSTSPRMAIYAIHNTPTSSDDNPELRQTAALLLDPGRPSTDPNGDLADDEKGRVYILSNDPAEYENNTTSEHPKPARTAARICDIPASVMNLVNISGVAPTPIVDPKYVRSEASYSESDQDKIANVLNSKWVRPTHKDVNGQSIYNNYLNENNIFVFQTMTGLKAVDLTLNGFRRKGNLNPMVDTSKVSIHSIKSGGSGYRQEDAGKIIIGGFAFTYVVVSVDENGAVTSATLSAPPETYINLSNFDMSSPNSAITLEYGTSPIGNSEGSGLTVYLEIADYDDLKPTTGEVYDDLYAYLVTNNGLYIASYSNGNWIPTSRICDYQESDPSGFISYKDAYINTIIPSVRELPIQPAENAQRVTTIQVLATSNFVNIIDSSKSPVNIAAGRDDIAQTEQVVDMNKWCMSWPKGGTASSRTTAAVLNWINNHDKPEYDSYLAWVWEQPQDASNLNFTYMFIRRSFSNLQSYDNVNLLPNTDIPYKAYVNTDRATTIVWNVPNVGPLMWVFDPTSATHERYYIDPNTRDLGVSRQPSTWKDVDPRTGPYDIVYYVSAAGKWRYRFNLHKIGSNGTFETAPFATYGSDYNDTDYQPTGSWKLVYPRVHTYHLSTDPANPAVEFTPARLQVLHVSNIQDTTDIIDQFGQPVNAKTIVIEDNASGAKLKVFNQRTGTWDAV